MLEGDGGVSHVCVELRVLPHDTDTRASTYRDGTDTPKVVQVQIDMHFECKLVMHSKLHFPGELHDLQPVDARRVGSSDQELSQEARVAVVVQQLAAVHPPRVQRRAQPLTHTTSQHTLPWHN